MTDPQPDIRTAGRDLDAAIAEHVMGWTVNRTSERHWHTVGPTGRERAILIGRDCCAGQHQYDTRAFCPSTQIEDAWLVVEKLGPKHMITLRRTTGGWWAHIGLVDEWATTAPLAICRAALTQPQKSERERTATIHWHV